MRTKETMNKFKGLLFAVCVLFSLALVGRVQASADTLTMTLERFSTGGGFIEEPTVVEFQQGETYEDVLTRVLKQKGYTYKSSHTDDKGFYLEGIDNVDVGISNMPSCVKNILTDRNTAITGNSYSGLYAFSYTSGSGWMYFVNNQYVNVGMSKCKPVQGDVVRFMFTLYLGADLTGQLRDYDTNQVTKTYYTTADKTELIRLMGIMNQDKAHWSGVAGFNSAYAEAVNVMAKMDATSNDVNEALSWLKEIQSGTAQEPTSIKFSNSSVSMKLGGSSVILNAEVLPSSSSKRLTWSSSNASVATVKNGVVTPVGLGTATITAMTSNGLSATCQVTVTNGSVTPGPTTIPSTPVGVIVNPSSLNLATGGKTSSLTYTVSPYGAKVNSVKWESRNTSVATVDSNGKVTSVGVGTADIRCTINGTVRGTCRVTVYPVAESISLNKTKISMNTGDAAVKLTYSLSPANAQTQVTWSSDDVAVARVTNSGSVSAVGAGETDIRVKTDNGKTASCHVTVTASPKEAFMTGMPKMTAKAISGNTVTVSWEAYEGAERYIVSRRSVGSGPLSQIASVTGLSYTDKTAKPGTTYYYSVKAASKKWGKEVFSSYDTNIQVKTPASSVKVGKTTISKVASSAYNKLKVTWKKVSKADGYIVYRSTSSNGTYKKVKEITKGSTASYTDTKLVTGRAYYYKVCAYRMDGDEPVYGADSAAKGGRPALSKPSVKLAAGAKKATVKWGKVNGASGYEIYRSASKNKGFAKVKTITKGSTVSYSQSKLTSGKTYYYRVRAYRMVNNKKVCGKFSAAKAVKVK